jgi:hypothetical protein
MATKKEDIRRWVMKGKKSGATHCLIVCDTFDWEDYPVYVTPGQDVREIAKQHNGPNMTKLMEVYSMKLDIEAQLKEYRSSHYD